MEVTDFSAILVIDDVAWPRSKTYDVARGARAFGGPRARFTREYGVR